jgi:homopolymeric O-antigen transport system permease protein
VSDQSTTVIRPPAGFAGLHLGELWRYRELLVFLVWRNVLVRYKQTLLGFLWAVLQPVLLMLIMTVFFGSYAKRAGVAAPVYYFAALVPWTFFANGLTQASNSLVQNANLISKVYFPRLAAPIAGVLAALVDFAFAFCVLGIMLAVYGVAPRPAAAAVIPAMLVLALATALGAGLWLSALNVSYRDVQYVVPFTIQIGLFMSIFASNVHAQPWRTLLGLNPMAGVIAGFRWSLAGGGSGFTTMIPLSVGVTVLVLASGVMYFRQVERGFADVI